MSSELQRVSVVSKRRRVGKANGSGRSLPSGRPKAGTRWAGPMTGSACPPKAAAWWARRAPKSGLPDFGTFKVCRNRQQPI